MAENNAPISATSKPCVEAASRGTSVARPPDPKRKEPRSLRGGEEIADARDDALGFFGFFGIFFFDARRSAGRVFRELRRNRRSRPPPPPSSPSSPIVAASPARPETRARRRRGTPRRRRGTARASRPLRKRGAAATIAPPTAGPAAAPANAAAWFAPRTRPPVYARAQVRQRGGRAAGVHSRARAGDEAVQEQLRQRPAAAHPNMPSAVTSGPATSSGRRPATSARAPRARSGGASPARTR